jgi:alpha-L-arabinofuranosidase
MLSKSVLRVGLILLLTGGISNGNAQTALATGSLTIHADQSGPVIGRDIFGQFAEQLGNGIYNGVWVGKDSPIPNVRGIRSDVVEALRALRVPNVRWPGGCFADEYHWRDGIGPADRRPVTYNISWGDNVETNAFGTDEFMDFVDQIGSDAYLTVNVGSGTVQEAANWLEYLTTNQPTTLGKERVANGHPAPYRVRLLGIGNENEACGGEMTAQAYVDRMKTYSLFVRNVDPAQGGPSRFMRGPSPMLRIAVSDEPEYTEAEMKIWPRSNAQWGFDGISVHHYTGTAFRDAATGFGEKEYADLVKTTYDMDDLISKRAAIMDQYDPQKKVALVIDEWGVWLRSMPGTKPFYLQQQNSLRDGILASLNLNIFARHADRVRMTNIAQMVNVLQSMILTDGPRMLLTPTYYIYKMYIPFQDAQAIPIDIKADDYKFGDTSVTKVDAIAARAKDGKVWVALTNIDPNNSADINTSVPGVQAGSAVGEVLTADRVDTVNTFDNSNAVQPKPFTAHATNGNLVLHLPEKSVTVVRLDP